MHVSESPRARENTTPTLARIVAEFLADADPHVLTAHDRLNTRVNWVHSSEIFEIGPLLTGGELLLTTGLGLAGLDAGTRRHYVRDLAERGVAGVAFEVGRTFETVPDEMVREGSARHLPIIELRRILPFIDVCRHANTAIVTGELGDLRIRSTLDAALHHDLVAATGIAGMLAHISEVARCPIVLVGSTGALLAAHGVDDDRSAWRVVDTAVAQAPVIMRGREIARVIAGPTHASISSELVATLLDCAAGPLGTALTRSGSGRSAVGVKLIEELLEGRPIRRADLLARLASSGASTAASAQLIPVVADSPDPRMAESALAGALSGLGGLVQATVDATVYGLVVVPTPTDGDDVVEQIASLLADGNDLGGRVIAVVGNASRLGGVGPGPALALAVAGAMRECAERLGIAVELMREGPWPARVCTARSLAADAAMRAVSASARDDLRALIDPLVRHDTIASTQLAHTLEIHLRHGCSATRSAEVLHIGRQSLYQRLERIRGVLGFDPTQPAMYTPVLLAFAAARAAHATAPTAH
ncbi:MAG: PucR family transcriptional regulator ligand-binding domain-containing protein [Gordonia sp. (in: high G+C Gram-positive bacteria)]